ncbi:MAG: lamin tail domain-containing protein [bacterium]
MAPSALQPGSPAKEYIYAGNRLVATEEPIPTPTPTPTPYPPCTPPTGIIISEFRLRGTGGSADEFIELYNNTDQAVSICTADGSNGWAIVSADGVVKFVLPYNTTVPARAHYLAVGSGYSLTNYATGDITLNSDAPDNAGLALFNTANPANFNTANRLDAVGFTSDSNGLYREGTGQTPIGTTNGEYSFARRLETGWAQDTGDNSADFAFLATDAGTYGGRVAILGAPGPENLSSPIQRNGTIKLKLIDTGVSSTGAPNRVRDYAAVGLNAALGTLIIRRKVNNDTGGVVTRLRFRLADITTLNSPGYVAGGGSQSDLRALSSNDITVTLSDGSSLLVRGTTLETPPAQSNGGGQNSTLAAGIITMTQPLAPGANLSVQFTLGVQQGGSYRFFVNVEALP